MSPLMIALPASSTHTQDMFDQLRTAAELELIHKTLIKNPGSTAKYEGPSLLVETYFWNHGKGRRSQQSMHRQCCDNKDSTEKKPKKNKNNNASLRKKF